MPVSSLPRVFAHVDAQRDAYLARLVDYLRRPSISAAAVLGRSAHGRSDLDKV